MVPLPTAELLLLLPLCRYVGREEVQAFLTRKWSKEQGYRLKKHLWAFEVGSRVRHEWMHAYALPLRPAMYEAFEFFFFFYPPADW